LYDRYCMMTLWSK